ncbi:hypothetical protein Mp_5g02170 [Marchantia polymorpha subsp. ruderalis]|uniref:Uncharacterized protein n=2 Tax=Marchantia polymorpha TaxID=3197 RepID=A0AAF6BE23_MARPO|nr:hypothetical protein MARPO_0147s0010 [Marchantia polymorpha]BBN10257.1 hypothetical protein Mp_5g02170 [Marchantia polymorpha subsp. ruderalis]|eukprot:PTQ29118.1 hypothetical protein MARPO_0147s0010 [Marchantia polymorpha]
MRADCSTVVQDCVCSVDGTRRELSLMWFLPPSAGNGSPPVLPSAFVVSPLVPRWWPWSRAASENLFGFLH